MNFLIGLVIVVFIIGFPIWLFIKVIGKIDDWAKSDPAVNEIFDYSNWKRNKMGVRGYITPEEDDRLRRIYNQERNR